MMKTMVLMLAMVTIGFPLAAGVARGQGSQPGPDDRLVSARLARVFQEHCCARNSTTASRRMRREWVEQSLAAANVSTVRRFR
jgi:hypothetical protein